MKYFERALLLEDLNDGFVDVVVACITACMTRNYSRSIQGYHFSYDLSVSG